MSRWERALVTGASAGIGEAIARELAAAGTDLVLVARRATRLAQLRDELAHERCEVEVLVADLSSDHGIRAVAARLADDSSPVDLLVNNAGLGSYGRFWEQPVEDARRQIDVNVHAVVALAHAAARAMVARGRGTILDVSSIAGNQPSPGNTVYAATKAFVTNFTEALAIELRGTGVTATASCPGLTHTEFHDVAGVSAHGAPELLWMDARTVARDALDAAARGRVVRVHGAGNRALAIGARIAPRALVRAVAGRAVAQLGARSVR